MAATSVGGRARLYPVSSSTRPWKGSYAVSPFLPMARPPVDCVMNSPERVVSGTPFTYITQLPLSYVTATWYQFPMLVVVVELTTWSWSWPDMKLFGSYGYTNTWYELLGFRYRP